MKKLPALLFAFAIISILPVMVHSQVNFFPPGAQWYYAFGPGMILVRGYTQYTYSGDTIIAFQDAKIIDRITYYFDYAHPTIPTDTVVRDPIFLAQSGDSIFYYDKYDSLFQLLWKQDVQTGDQFEVFDGWDTYTMDIDSTETLMFDTLAVNKIWLSGGTGYGQSGESIIYDRFGPGDGFVYYSCWGFYDCYPPTLCRYYSDVSGEINFTGSDCIVLTTATESISAKEYFVYPNPFKGEFFIQLTEQVIGNIRVEVYNLMGQLVDTEVTSNGGQLSVRLEDPRDGVYFCKVGDGRKIEMTKLFSKE